MARSSLMDALGVTRDLESAFMEMVDRGGDLG